MKNEREKLFLSLVQCFEDCWHDNEDCWQDNEDCWQGNEDCWQDNEDCWQDNEDCPANNLPNTEQIITALK